MLLKVKLFVIKIKHCLPHCSVQFLHFVLFFKVYLKASLFTVSMVIIFKMFFQVF